MRTIGSLLRSLGRSWDWRGGGRFAVGRAKDLGLIALRLGTKRRGSGRLICNQVGKAVWKKKIYKDEGDHSLGRKNPREQTGEHIGSLTLGVWKVLIPNFLPGRSR